MSLFNFNQEELLSFFGVLVRFSVLCSVLPFIGDRFVPVPVKILLSLAMSIALFPALVARGEIRPADSLVWGATTSGIAGTIALEAVVALVLGFTAKLIFETIHFGATLMGNFMGFAMASTYDPHQEAQSEVVAEVQMAIAMLLFLAIDGHHVMLRTSLDSYRIVGLGGLHALTNAGFGATFSQRLIEVSGQVVKMGVQLAAPVAVALFSVNVAFGVFSKAMPQLNVFILSFAVSALVGLVVMFLSVPEFQGASTIVFERMSEWMNTLLRAMASGR